MPWFYRKEIKWNIYWKLEALWVFYRKDKRIFELVRCTNCWYEHYVDRPTLLSLKSWCRMCWHNKHWLARSRLKSIFYNIKHRCEKEYLKCYHNYWWRWIKCLRLTFNDFIKDMMETYEEHIKKYWEKDTTIDRIDVDGDYCKENCRRATMKEQGQNRRNNKNFTI